MPNKRLSRNDEKVKDYVIRGWADKWTEWHLVMRNDGNGTNYGPDYEKRDTGLIGYRATYDKMREWFGEFDDGIYEWKTTGPRGGRSMVVYVGKTSSSNPQSLVDRLMDYTVYDSHKRDEINVALKDGKTLMYARVLPCSETGETAEDMERKCLEKCEYLWNERQ